MAENTKEHENQTLGEEEKEEKMEEGGEEGEEGSDSDDSDDNDTISNPRIQQLELQVASNPYHYDSHVELIKLLRESGDLDKVRQAREGMSKIFPLTQELWSEWFKDEMPLACIPEHKEKVITLFEQAVKDYQSVQLWTLYCQFMMDIMEGEDSLEGVRSTFEKAIIAAGLHVTEGSAIWDGYREFESDILESLEQMVSEENKGAMMEKIAAQRERVVSIYKRQLAVPLLGMQGTLREFEDWLEDSIPEAVTIVYEKALAKLEECLPYEDTLASAKTPRTTEYKSYLEYELKKGDAARIQCLYERAMKENCLVGDMWTEYASYLDSTLKITSVIIGVHERAVRNCPWVSLLWQNYIRALERTQQDKGKIKETLDTALGCGFSISDDYLQLWQCYCDYVRRQVDDWSEDGQQVKELRETFQMATEYLQNYFGKKGDPTNLLDRYWARIEAFHVKNITECQRIWDNAILSNHGREAEFWLEYANILRCCRDVKKCRKILLRAVQSASDNPEMVIQALLSFEREEGTLEDWDAAFSKCRLQLLRVNERRQKAAEKESARAKAEEEAQEKRKLANAERKAAKKVEQKKAKLELKKRKASGEGVTIDTGKNDDHSGEPAAKKPHVEKESDTSSTTTTTTTTTTTQKSVAAAEKLKHDSAKDSNTIFVSNLLFSIDEERLKDTFAPLGEISEVRLVRNQMGKSKGFAYVEFKTESSVQAALSMDRTKLEGRPMFISQSVDKSKNPTQFKFPTSLDKKTLFVSNLPFEIKESDLEPLFKEHGKINQIRLVTNRAGKPKGFGYIEYEEETGASSAIVALDGTQVGDRQISVALSNPPSRKPRQPGGEHEQRPKGQPESRGRARTQLQLLPRSLRKPTSSASAPSTNGSMPPSEEKAEASNGVERNQGFNNDYFRSLLQAKK